MRNLKRVLSLALAAMMLMGMMVVGASAADAKDFTDYDEIQHTEAVSTMVTLNVIAGKEDGSSFDPAGTLTREEMSKIITYVMNGGIEPSLGIKDVPTYADIDGNWAEKYIEYCTSAGIIAGDGAGNFNPKGTLTGDQFAKALLTAMGYNADVFGFIGNNWAVNVGRYANEAGLYEDLEGLDPSEPISRDDACQMAYNAILAPMMIRTWNQNQATGEVTETYILADGKGTAGYNTLLIDKFDGHVYEGVLAATGEYDLTANAALGDNNRNDAASIDGFVVNVDRIDSQTATGGEVGNTYFEYEDQDLTAMMGQYVKVLYNAKKELVYGVYTVADKNTVVETVTTKTDYAGLTNKVKIDGTTYNVESDIRVIYGNANDITDGFANVQTYTRNLNAANKVVFVDNDGNGKFDVALVTPVNVAEITFMNDTNLTMAVQSTASGPINGLSQLVEDVILSDGLAKGDYAILTPSYYNDADTLTKVDVVSGSVSGVRGAAAPYSDYQIDGEWVKPATGYAVNTTIKSGSSVNYIAVDGVLYYAKLTSGATLDNVAVISEMGVETTAFGDNLKAKVMLSDGTTKEVTVGALYDDVDDTTSADLVDTGAVDAEAAPFIGILVSYEINNDGKYEFYKLTDTTNNKAGFDKVLLNVRASYTGGAWTINGTPVSDDAVIVVRNAAFGTNSLGSKITTLTGAEFKKVTGVVNGGNYKFDTTDGAYALVGKDSDGFTRVMFGIVETTTEGYDAVNNKFTLDVISGSNYGYLTKDSWYETIDGSNYNCFEIWNGDETVVVKEKASKAFYAKRSIITFDVVGDGIIKNVTDTAAAASYITAVTEGKAVEIGGTEYKITSDSVILNINDVEAQGVVGNAILIAREIGDTGSFYKNSYFTVNGADEIEVLVVDVAKNELYGTPVVLGSGVTDTAIKGYNDGVYYITNIATLPGVTGVNASDLMIFKFTARVTSTTPAAQNYTLSIKGSDGIEDYSEVANFGDNTGGHFFYIDVTDAIGSGNVTGADLAADNYTVTITGADGIVYLQSNFEIQA